MRVGVLDESYDGELRVALTPAAIPRLIHQARLDVWVESGAGAAAGFTDAMYAAQGARIGRAAEVMRAELIARVRVTGRSRPRRGQIVLGMIDPPTRRDVVVAHAERGATLMAMDLVPPLARAHGMDASASMATVAGYKAVLVAAGLLPNMFPLRMTAAGTLAPVKVLVLGAGIAGLQACATARRLGAIVSAHDVGAEELVASVGATFVDREQARRLVGDSDVIITTAAALGPRAPLRVTAAMVATMRPGSVIVDLAAAGCELTRLDETVVQHGVTIAGPIDLAATVPQHASQLYAKNVANLLAHLVDEHGRIDPYAEDEITAGVVVTRAGEIVHPQVRATMGLQIATTSIDHRHALAM